MTTADALMKGKKGLIMGVANERSIAWGIATAAAAQGAELAFTYQGEALLKRITPLAEKVGSIFPGRVNGVTRFGLFITLDDSGADGLVPMRSLPDDYYIHDETRHLLRGRRSKRVFRLGDKVDVMLMEADPVTGSMIMQVIDGEALQSPKRATARARGPSSKKPKKTVKKSKSKSRAGRRKARTKH